jgi:hypothetical protein
MLRVDVVGFRVLFGLEKLPNGVEPLPLICTAPVQRTALPFFLKDVLFPVLHLQFFSSAPHTLPLLS